MKGISVRNIKANILIVFLIIVSIINHVLILPLITSYLSYGVLILFVFFEPKYKKFYKLLFPLILILIIGLLSSVLYNTRDVVRDVYYFINPIIFMIIGTFIAQNITFEKFLLLIIRLGTLLSIIYVIEALMNFGLFFWNYSFEIRSALGVGNSLSVLALVLILYSRKYEELCLINKMKFRWLLIVINFFALLLFGSRTYFGVFFILVAVLSYPLLKKNIIKFLSYSVILLFITVLLLNQFKDAFIVEKLMGSFTEITITSDLDPENIYINFRGYETKSAVDTYNEGNDIQKLIGFGFGKLIDLKMYVELAGSDWRYIPILHNGYVYLLVKTGIIGFFLFFLFFLNVILLSRSVYNCSKIKSLLVFGVMSSICFATFIVGGFFNIEFELMLIILGGMLQYLVFEKLNQTVNKKY